MSSYTMWSMSRQNHLLHFHISKKRQVTLIDKIAIIVAFIYPASGLPQAVEVFQGNIEGVSVLTWASFIAFSVFFLVYGLVHKITPMVITNILWIVVDGSVVVGVLMNGMLY